jgi:hypothetical protein
MGGVQPVLEHKMWHLPVGSLLVRKISPDSYTAQALLATRCPINRCKGWKRRHFLYQNPELPFHASAIVYRDQMDMPCFVEEFTAGGEAIVAGRYLLES